MLYQTFVINSCMIIVDILIFKLLVLPKQPYVSISNSKDTFKSRYNIIFCDCIGIKNEIIT